MSLKKCIVLLLMGSLIVKTKAQSDILTSKAVVKTDTAASSYWTGTPQKDVGDIWRQLLRKEPKIEKADKKSFNMVIPSVSYSIATGFMVVATNNIVLFLDKNDQTNRSTILSQAVYSQKNQVFFISNSNIWLPKRRLNLLGDYRFYKFPTATYGLGGFTQNSDELYIDYRHVRVYQAALAPIKNNFFAGLGFNLNHYWRITDTDSTLNNLRNHESGVNGLSDKSTSSGLSVNLLFDNQGKARNSSYFYTRFIQNLKALGSNTNWQSLLIEAKQVLQISEKRHQSLAFWSYNWLTLNGDAPYLDMPSTGWDAYNNMGRGYVVGRFRGRNLLYLESEFRFGLTKNGLLGAVVFANAQSVTHPISNRFETLLPGTGAGLRLKLNKKANSVVAIDYAIGRYGSRGFFFNFNEVF